MCTWLHVDCCKAGRCEWGSGLALRPPHCCSVCRRVWIEDSGVMPAQETGACTHLLAQTGWLCSEARRAWLPGKRGRHLHAACSSQHASVPHQPTLPASATVGGTWRFTNVTLMCTGPTTHPAQHKLHGLLLSGPAHLLAAAAACAIAAAWWRRCSSSVGEAASLLLVPAVGSD